MNCTFLSSLRASLPAAVLVLSSLPCAVHAQDATKLVRVNVPFAFESGSRHFQAGSYVVSVDSRRFLTVSGNGQQAITMGLPDEALTPEPATVVVFRRYGDRYFLRALRIAGLNSSTHTTITKQERQVQIAAEQARTPGVLVALANAAH